MSRELLCAISVCLAVSVLFFVDGCSSSSTERFGQVKGIVTVDGTPLMSGTIQFVSAKGIVEGVGIIKPGGEYQLQRNGRSEVPVGEYLIQIAPPMLSEADRKAKKEKSIQLIAESARKGDRPKIEEEPLPVPSKYLLTTTSKLQFTIESGSNSADFDLKTKDD